MAAVATEIEAMQPSGILQAKGLLTNRDTVVGASFFATPGSAKNVDGERDPERNQMKNGNQWYFGMKAHIGVDAESGLVYSVVGTSANVNDMTHAGALLHGEEESAFGDAGYRGVHMRAKAQGSQ